MAAEVNNCVVSRSHGSSSHSSNFEEGKVTESPVRDTGAPVHPLTMKDIGNNRQEMRNRYFRAFSTDAMKPEEMKRSNSLPQSNYLGEPKTHHSPQSSLELAAASSGQSILTTEL